jgi:hypothetical protein
MARDWERICYEMTACWASEEAFQHGRNVSIWSTTSIPRRSRFSAIEGMADTGNFYLLADGDWNRPHEPVSPIIR